MLVMTLVCCIFKKDDDFVHIFKQTDSQTV